MITFADDYSKFVFSKTLQHMANAEGFNEHSKDGHRTFLDYATNFLMMAHQDVNLMISRADVSEDGIAKEISFKWDNVHSDEIDGFIQESNWYDLDLSNYKGGRPLVGALINHGTEDEPRWGSHT